MRKIILSFDYEIYFDGKNNYQSLISNTHEILRIADRHSIKCVFFVDAFYVYQLKKANLETAYDDICNQLKTMQSKGHELQYHFHPHWLNAVYVSDKNEWQYNKSDYSYSDLVDQYGIEKANEAFEIGLNCFEQISQTKSIAFRAGGLSVQGAEAALIDLLVKHGFIYDSSIMPQLQIEAKYLNIDHSSSPNKDLWMIDQSFLIESNKTSRLTEIPLMMLDTSKSSFLTSLPVSILYRLLKVFEIKPKANHINGKPMDLNIQKVSYPESITFDLSSGADSLLMKHCTKLFFSQKRTLMCMISHPKSMERPSLLTMNTYCKWLKKQAIQPIGFSDLN